MKYRVTIEGRAREVEVTLTPSGGASVTLDGAPLEAEVRRVPGGVSLRIGHAVHDISVASASYELQLASRHTRTIALDAIARQVTKARASGGGTGSKELRAPMPGRVVRVIAAAGTEVAAGDPVIVIEAMKMENELRAHGPGRVREVHVQEGASVEGKALLVSFE